jgi:aerobic-type carbon monoxide dehydrogenase small subunit (CoxS/CutS family)
MIETVEFRLNRKPVHLRVDVDRMLLWVLRTDLGLPGTKYGCGEGHCGACSVIINDKTERSCQIPVKDIQGKEVLTIEGLARNGVLHPIQKAFVEIDALQCGFCTPGMIMTAYGLLRRNPQPSESEIVRGMDGNLCRCCSQARVIQAVQKAALTMRAERIQ